MTHDDTSEEIMTQWIKVGELARRTGVSVRTLHYYEEHGILHPSHRTDSGHRLYGHAQVERLCRIRAMQHLGFELDTIAEALDRTNAVNVEALIAERLMQERDALKHMTRRVRFLERVEAALATSEASSMSSLVSTIEEITMYEKHYTPEQLEQLAARRESFTEEEIQGVQQQWEDLFAEVRTVMEEGARPDDERCAPIVARWDHLVSLFTGGDQGIRKSLDSVWEHEGDALAQTHGYDPSVMQFVERMRVAQS